MRLDDDDELDGTGGDFWAGLLWRPSEAGGGEGEGGGASLLDALYALVHRRDSSRAHTHCSRAHINW